MEVRVFLFDCKNQILGIWLMQVRILSGILKNKRRNNVRIKKLSDTLFASNGPFNSWASMCCFNWSRLYCFSLYRKLYCCGCILICHSSFNNYNNCKIKLILSQWRNGSRRSIDCGGWYSPRTGSNPVWDTTVTLV